MVLVAIEIQKVNNTAIIYEFLYVFTFLIFFIFLRDSPRCNLDFVVGSPRTIKKVKKFF